MRLTIIALALACFVALTFGTTTATADTPVDTDKAAPSVLDQALAVIAQFKAEWKAYKEAKAKKAKGDKDGPSPNTLFLVLVLSVLGVASTWGKTVLRYIQKRSVP